MGVLRDIIIGKSASGVVVGGKQGGRKTNKHGKGGFHGEADLFPEAPHGNRGPFFPPIPMPRTTDNIITNRMLDNKEPDDDPKCILYPYRERKEKCPNNASHHAIPDHCWRMGNSVLLALGKGATSWMPEAMSDKLAQEFEESMSHDGKYYYDKMNKEEGLAICVTGAGKTLDHGKIHALFDEGEKKLGENGIPQWTATLGDLEDLAADAIAATTGCDRKKMKDQLRKYHQAKSLEEKFHLRADPFGKNTTSMTNYGIDPIIRMRMEGHGI